MKLEINKTFVPNLNGTNVIHTIALSVLTKNVGFYHLPYSNVNGNDVKSLSVEILKIEGCAIDGIPIGFRYNFAEKKACVTVDWNAIEMKEERASIKALLTANYGFEEIIVLKLACKSNLSIANIADHYTIYKGEGSRILSFTLESKIQEVRNVKLKIVEGNHIASLDRNINYASLSENDPKTIKLKIKEGAQKSTRIVIEATADNSKFERFSFIVDTKEKEKPRLDFSYTPEMEMVYTQCTKKKIGVLKLTSKSDLADINAVKAVNISNVKLSSSHASLFFINAEGFVKSQLLVGDSQLFNIYITCDESHKLPSKVNFKFGYLDVLDLTEHEITISEREYVSLPVIKFECEKGIIFPVAEGKTLVGLVKIDLSKVVDNEKEKERKGLALRLREGDYSFENGSRELLDIKDGEYPVFLNIHKFFSPEINVKDNRNLNVPLIYSDELPGKEMNVSETRFVVHPYEAKSKLVLSYRDKNSKEFIPIILDKKNTAEIVLPDIEYTQLLLEEEISRHLLTLSVENAEKIPFADNRISISKLDVIDNHFIVIDPLEDFKIRNGEDAHEIELKLIWEKVKKNTLKKFEGFTLFSSGFTINFKMRLIEKRNNYWYSLDLGTTGIVMAKMVNGQIDLITLTDNENSLEKDDNVVSSIMVIAEDKNKPKVGKVILSPELGKYNGAKFVCPPTKFIVGQEHVPFIEQYKEVFKFVEGEKLSKVDLTDLVPDKLLQMVYEDIFARLGNNENMQKLIITYPNTYTPEQIDKISKVISDKYSDLKEHLHFVPESDAVLAFYIEKRIDVGGLGFKKENERILIYDMGAGTLDISYVIVKTINNQLVASIEKKIGIPLAGNYLDYLIYQALVEIVDMNMGPRQVKNSIKEKIKCAFSQHKDYENIKINSLGISVVEGKDITLKELLENSGIQNYLTLCTEKVFELLLGDNWKNGIDTIVFSGRGSLFQPLRDKIKEISPKNESMWMMDTYTIKDLKTCVAHGAIKYYQIFAPDSRQPFRIESRNLYHKIGVVYRTFDHHNEHVYKYQTLIDPETINWTKVPVAHATKCQLFEGSVIADIRPCDKIQFIQTSLGEEDIKNIYSNRSKGEKDNENSCFINEIFYINSNDVNCIIPDPKAAEIVFGIDCNKKISLKIQGIEFRQKRLVERIEDNIFYINSTWPFNNQISKK